VIGTSTTPGDSRRATLSAFGAPPQPADVWVETLGPGRRAGRALVALAACWGLAFPAVFLPVAHFVLVPGLLLAGPVLAALRLREGRRLVEIRGACPRCGVRQQFRPGGRLRPRRTIDCPRCHSDLTLDVETSTPDPPSHEAPAPSG
jgi:hypothetical protein